jgi:C1A family cysteine protease
MGRRFRTTDYEREEKVKQFSKSVETITSRAVTCLMALALVSLLLVPLTAWSDPVELGYVKNAIKGKGAKWQAEETSVSQLSAEEKSMRANLKIKPNEEEEASSLSMTPPETVAPPAFDWRSYNGSNYVTSVKNQGSCGSCWAFAATGVLEAVTNIKNNSPGYYNFDLAEQILLSCSGAGSCNGGYTSSAVSYIQSIGLPFETIYPYTGTNGVCSNATANWQTSTYKINSYAYVSFTVDAIKNALVAYGPLVTQMAVYNDFFYYKTGVYSYTTGSLAGYHAIVIVGYDDVNQCFVVKNSWGAGWGEAGFFRIAYSEMNSVVGFGRNTIAYYPSAPPAPEPTYGISPVSVTYPASGGSGTVTVTEPSGTAWKAISNNTDWITVISGSSGSGTGTVQYKVSTSTSTTARTGSLTIAGETFSVQQKAVVIKGKKK